MKWSFLFAILFLNVASLPARQEPSPRPRESEQRSSGANQVQKDASAQNQHSAQPETVIKQANPKGNQAQSGNVTPHTKEEILKRLQIWVKDWGILVFSGLLVIVGGLQVWILKRQTSISSNAERAWIIASPIERKPDLYFIPEPGDPVGPARQNVFAATIKNMGRTPAHIMKTSLYYDTFQTLTEMPPVPRYQNVISHEGLILIPNGEPIAQVAYLQPETILSKAKARAVENRDLYLFAYGFIQYRDVFKRVHTCRFGYLYNFPQGGEPQALKGFMPGGPKSYNKAT